MLTLLCSVMTWADEETLTLTTTTGIEEVTVTKQGASGVGGDLELSKGDITVTSSLGYFKGSGSDGIQIYKNGSMNVSVPSTMKITKIVLTYAGTCYPFVEDADNDLKLSSKGQTDGQQDATYTIDSPASSITFTNNATGQTKVRKIVVTYSASGGSTPTALSAPSKLVSSNITTTGATLSWDAVSNASSYTVKIGETEYADVKTNSYSATGLTAGTQYTWTVKAVGDGTSYSTSAYASNATFTTEAEQGGEEPTPVEGDKYESGILGYEAFGLTPEGTNTYAQPAAESNSITFDGITLTLTKNDGTAVRFDETYVRVYQKNTMTITAPTGRKIAKIELNKAGGDWKSGMTVSPTCSTYKDGDETPTWTGSATSVSFTPGGTHRLASVTVYLEAETPEDPVPTYTLSEFIAKKGDLTENDVFNVTIEDITIVNTHDATDAEAYMVTISPDSYVWVYIYAPAPTPAKEWTVGGTLSGSLTNVTWNGSAIVGEDASVWEGLTYKPIQTYTLSELFGTPSKDYVNAEVDDVIESCVKDAGVYKVTLNSGVSLIIRTDNLDWVADGTVKGTLNDVQWRGDNNTIYGKTTDYWEALTYNAPAPTYASLDELIDANLEEPTVVNVTIGNTVLQAMNMGESNVVYIDNNGDYIVLAAPGSDLGWEMGGTVSGTLNNVTWDPEEYTLQSETNFWSSLEYTAPAGAPTETIYVNPACTDGDLYYSTYSSANAFYVPEDITVYEVAIVDDELLFDNYKTGDLVPPYRGVIICATEGGNFDVEIETDNDMWELAESVLGDDNALRPTCFEGGLTAEDMSAEDPGMKYYRLTMHNGTQCGFWWGAAEGAAFNIAENKAYLVAGPAVNKAKGFSFKDITTGIEKAMAEKANNKVRYNLNGQRVNANAKGIIIVNGKKVIKK